MASSTYTPSTASSSSVQSAHHCVAMARQARLHAEAFHRSVKDFDQIDITRILGRLETMRQLMAH